MTADQLEAKLRELGHSRYHVHHPFHKLLHSGALSKGQVQAWALNRYYYQSAIPRKDAALIARANDPALRRAWRTRLEDHDGTGEDDGGIFRWLMLTDGLDLSREDVRSERGILPATRFAVEAYVRFVTERSLLEAVASSLTELFAPTIIAERMSGMIQNYNFIDPKTLAYFDKRIDQAPRDACFALDYVRERARSAQEQQTVLDAMLFKCDVLWSQLDALYYAYIEPGFIPPGCFRPRETL